MDVPELAPEPEAAPEEPIAPRKRSRVGWIVAISLLVLVLGVTAALLVLAMTKLQEARDEIGHQREIIDEKETFASAAQELMSTVAQYDGLPYAQLVDTSRLNRLIRAGWTDRWDPAAVEDDIESVNIATEDFAAVLAAAKEQAATNGTGTFFETITDDLGGGFVATSLNTADALCGRDVLGCVDGSRPFTIHYDATEAGSIPVMNDFLRSGIAYHEYAHILQYANPIATNGTARWFGGDWETMADCYALTFLPNWTLDHRIWVSDYEYWDISFGYGYTCNEAQRQEVRNWVEDLGYTHYPISQ